VAVTLLLTCGPSKGCAATRLSCAAAAIILIMHRAAHPRCLRHTIACSVPCLHPFVPSTVPLGPLSLGSLPLLASAFLLTPTQFLPDPCCSSRSQLGLRNRPVTTESQRGRGTDRHSSCQPQAQPQSAPSKPAAVQGSTQA
jgi:hypothetical protein